MDRDGKRHREAAERRIDAHDRSAAQTAYGAETVNEAEIDALADRFFSQDSLYPVSFDVSEDSAVPAPRGAMFATLILLGGSSVLIGAFVIYSRWIMPVPAELGASKGLEAFDIPSATLAAQPMPQPRNFAPLTATLAEPDEPSAPASNETAPPPAAKDNDESNDGPAPQPEGASTEPHAQDASIAHDAIAPRSAPPEPLKPARSAQWLASTRLPKAQHPLVEH